MPGAYLPKGHPDEYKDIDLREPVPDMGLTEICPECNGHGKRNLTIDAYGPGKHFQQSCWCMGHGYRRPGECLHKRTKHVAIIGNCLNRYRCLDCGRLVEIDSSD